MIYLSDDHYLLLDTDHLRDENIAFLKCSNYSATPASLVNVSVKEGLRFVIALDDLSDCLLVLGAYLETNIAYQEANNEYLGNNRKSNAECYNAIQRKPEKSLYFVSKVVDIS